MQPPIYTNSDGVALNGHDPVAYFTVGAPTKGNPSISREWSGAIWLFSSTKHRDLFDADPHSYAPAFGGHCAVGQVTGRQFRGSPKRWRIEDDRLFVNKNLMASVMFRPFRTKIHQLARRSQGPAEPQDVL